MTDSLSASKSFVVKSSNVKTKRPVDSRDMGHYGIPSQAMVFSQPRKRKMEYGLKSKESAAEVWAVIVQGTCVRVCVSVYVYVHMSVVAMKDRREHQIP